MGQKNKKVQTTPTLAEYLAQRAQQVRDSAANVYALKDMPEVPIIPKQDTFSKGLAWLGLSDDSRIKIVGKEETPLTCIYTTTNQYGDEGAKVPGNITFKNNPRKYGFEPIPMNIDSIGKGDLIQFAPSKKNDPIHTGMVTGTYKDEFNDKELPTLTYSRGGTGITTQTNEGTKPTMVHNRPWGEIVEKKDYRYPTAYRYVGSPQKQQEWTNEYNTKYGTQRSNGRLGVTARWAEGGFLQPRDAWDKLSIEEQAAMMKAAVSEGIFDLSEIRKRYNEFAEGGDTDWSYNSWKRQIAKYMDIRPDEDKTYDYEAYFRKYPEEAWRMLKGDPNAHFSDEFKTVYHPTFSSKSIGNDGSIYSGVRNSKTNPQGLVGGTWSPDYHTFTMSSDGYRGPVGMDDRKWYLENAEDNGVQLREANGSLPIYDGIPWGGVLPNVTIYGSKHSLGGPLVEAAMNEYRNGGGIHIKPSHRGRLTELKKRTGKTEAELYRTGSPATRKMITFARNARKWKHGEGGNLFLTGGPKRQPATVKPAKKNRFEDMSIEELEAVEKANEEYWRKQQEELYNRTPEQTRQMGIEADKNYRQRNPNGGEADPNLQRSAGVVMSALSDIANSTPFTGSEVAEAAEAQRQEKLDKAHELKMGLDATMTAAEFLAAGYGVTRGLTHLNRYMARQATQSTGQAISRDAMRNLAKWNRRVAQIDKPQVLMNGIGGTADAYQWYTADNSFDAWENGLETGANAAGVVGGMNWFRDLPYLRRIGGDKIDAVLDGMGYSAATWDIVKNLPPLSTALESAREESKRK